VSKTLAPAQDRKSRKVRHAPEDEMNFEDFEIEQELKGVLRGMSIGNFQLRNNRKCKGVGKIKGSKADWRSGENLPDETSEWIN